MDNRFGVGRAGSHRDLCRTGALSRSAGSLAVWPIALGIASVLFPWVADDGGSRSGLAQPDGLLTLIGGTIAMALAWRAVSFGWIVSGFLAVLLGRDILILVETPRVRPGVGLWVGAIAYTLAAGIQLAGLVRSRLTSDEDP